MKNKIHYYLRFTLAYTHSEIRGLWVLLGGMLLYVFVAIGIDYYKTAQERIAFNPLLWEANYQAISPKVFVPRKFEKYKNAWVEYKSDVRKPPKKQQSIDINTADSAAWVALNGIGPGFAKRIIAYREKLGGFYQVDQLKEVYGLDSVWVKENKALLKVGAGVYRFLKINQVEWKDFRHPYLPYGQSKIILAYRKQHGPFNDFETLQQIPMLDLVAWRRLKPYISFAAP